MIATSTNAATDAATGQDGAANAAAVRDTAFWDRIAPKYATDPIADPAAYEETLDRMRHHLRPEHRVVEIGCGTGSTALALAPAVAAYVGTDVSPRMIGIAEGKRREAGADGLSFEARAAGDLPPGPFDAVLALNLLHLVADLDDLLARVADALPTGGLFVSKTALLADGAWFLRPAVALMRAVGKAPRTVLSLRQGELRARIERSGFAIEETILQPGIAPRLFVVARRL